MNQHHTRRSFLRTSGLIAASAAATSAPKAIADEDNASAIPEEFFVRPEELTLKFNHGPGERRMSFAKFDGSAQRWRGACREKLAELLGLRKPIACPVRLLRETMVDDIAVQAQVMEVGPRLTIPAYFLKPKSPIDPRRAVMAIHGHGDAESAMGLREEYHHTFALRLAQAGHIVLCPALRGFGALGDLAYGDEDYTLDYWRSSRGRQFTLVSDAFLHGRTLVGETVEDLLRWEHWLAKSRGIESLDVAGISYGGDLTITYPVFSPRVRKIYSSGSLGSFSVIFSRCYNAPAHGIPHILRWMDRSDIAGLNAPRPMRFHYGEHDKPGPHNASASYNETVEPSLAELRAIYRALGASADSISLKVTPGRWHEMDNEDLLAFLAE